MIKRRDPSPSVTILPKSIFFHIPRTGGTWVRHVLRDVKGYSGISTPRYKHKFDLLIDHASPKRMKKSTLEGKFLFAFVRNPLSWYQSYWAFRGERIRRELSVPENDIDWLCGSKDFNAFVKNCLNLYPYGLVTRVYKEFEHLDFVGRQEHLQKDLRKALRLAGEDTKDCDFKLKKVNEALVKKPKYDTETWMKVRRVEHWVYRRFYE